MNKKDLVLRKYQEEAINVGAEYFSRKNKQKPSIMVEPVAAGKSLIIGSIAEKMSTPTLVLQPSVELLVQNYEKLLWFGGKATIYSASAGVKEISLTTYATLGSIKKIAKQFKDIGVENVIIDECLSYDTYISLQNSKPKKIGNLYNKYIKGDPIPKVKTINEYNNEIEYKDIKKVMFNGIKDIYKAKFNSKVTVKCTLEHRFLTVDKGWIKLKDLKLGDKIRTSITGSEAIFKGKEFYKKDKVYDLTINDNHNYTICNKNTTDGIIVHNCHYGYSPKTGSMFRNFMEELNPKKVLGFTATPIRLNTYGTIERTYSQLDFLMKGRKGAPAYFKDIIHLTQIEEMVTNKFWAKLSYEQYDFDESVLTLNTTGAEYTEHSISEAIEKNGVNNNIYLRIKSLLRDGAKNILVFVDSIETANKFETLFDSCKAVTGSMNKKDRKKIIEDFKNGDLKIVVNFGTLTTGFDHPWLDTVILGRPTQSFALYYQIVGRVTRNPLYPKQKDALVIDFCNNVKRFGKLENVNFEYIEGYGWGMFSNDNLLSNHPMDLPVKTKEDINNDLLDSYEDTSDIKLWFGKYKGKRLSEVPVYWAEWAYKNMDFKGKKMLQLKNQITKILIKNGKLKNV